MIRVPSFPGWFPIHVNQLVENTNDVYFTNAVVKMVIEQKNSNHDGLKQALKEAFVEVLREERDLVREIILEALEDSALIETIREGEKSELVDRKEVSDILSKSQ